MPTVYTRTKDGKPVYVGPEEPGKSSMHSSGNYKVVGNKVLLKNSKGKWMTKYTTTTNVKARKLTQQHYGK